MIKINVRNNDVIAKKISDLPRGVRGAAAEAAAFALIGNQSRGLQHYPARVEHGSENPYQWESDKQRRAYFATNGFGGGIPYQRTDNLRFGWKVIKWGDGVNTKVVNDVPYAPYVMGATQQKGHKADKWRQFQKVITDVQQSMRHAIDQAVARWLRSRGL